MRLFTGETRLTLACESHDVFDEIRAEMPAPKHCNGRVQCINYRTNKAYIYGESTVIDMFTPAT